MIRLLSLFLLPFVPGAHVVLHKAVDVWEGLQARSVRGTGVQTETSETVLDANVRGPATSFNRQCQHIERVAAVPYQESTL